MWSRRGAVQCRGSPATRSIRCSEYPHLPNRRPPVQADPPFRPRAKVGQGKYKAWRRRFSRLDAGSALSFGRSSGELSGPALFGWPYCGCATACVAAEDLGRRWIGIDISPKAVELVNICLQQSMDDLFHNRLVTARTDIPRRTDIDAPVPYRQNKHVLFGQQEGRCNGCRSEFTFRVLKVDHIIPRGGGGPDNIENLQLLCAHCNRVKGDRP